MIMRLEHFFVAPKQQKILFIMESWDATGSLWKLEDKVCACNSAKWQLYLLLDSPQFLWESGISVLNKELRIEDLLWSCGLVDDQVTASSCDAGGPMAGQMQGVWEGLNVNCFNFYLWEAQAHPSARMTAALVVVS